MTFRTDNIPSVLGYAVALSGAAITCTILAIWVYHGFIDPLGKVPGPPLYAISSLPYLKDLVNGAWAFKLKEYHDRYGPVVRFTPKDVSFITPPAWNTIYGHKRPGQLHFNKDKRIYRGSLTGVANILVADDADHSRMRRTLAHAFSEKALRGQEDIMQHYVAILMRQLRSRAVQGKVVNMVQWFNFTTFDIIGDLAFGEPFGCLESGGYHPWVAMIFDGFRLATMNQALKRLPILAPLLSRFLPHDLIKRQRVHFQNSFEKAQKRIATGKTDRQDFMSYILRYNDEKGMTAEEIGENANVLIVAGSETTATLLSGTTFWLLKNPEAYQKLVSEIRSSFAREEDITMTSVANAKYLLAVINEGLRMMPPIPSGLGRCTPNGGALVDEYWMPAGTVVSVPSWAASQSFRNFARPGEFVPERWLDDPEFKDDVRDVLQPFSFGPRNCLGKNLAYAEMRLILARLVWNFEMELMPASSSWNKQKIFLFWDKPALQVRLTPVRRT